MARVSEYVLYAKNGKRIGKKTQVKIGNETIRFTEKMSKKSALEQAEKILARRRK